MVPEGATLEKVRERLQELNEVNKPYKFWAVTEQDIVFLEKNARYMTKEQLAKLTANVKQDDMLTQTPFGMKLKENGKFLILSGNHRCKSAIKAQLPYWIIQYVDQEDITDEKALAIQLSHNAISGQDDNGILKELYQMITSLEGKEYSAIDEKALMAYDSLEFPPITEGEIKLHEMRLIFSGKQYGDLLSLENSLRALGEEMTEGEELRFCAVPFRYFVEVMSEIKDIKGVKNNTIGFVKMLQICQEWVDNHKAEQN